MASVTSRIQTIKQPSRFIKISDFEMIPFDDGFTPSLDENLHPTIVGMAVDYLTRFMLGEKKETAFHISIQGAMLAEKMTKKKVSVIADRLISNITGIDKRSIVSACKLVSFDVWYRNPLDAIRSKTYKEVEPDEKTIANIAKFVSRGVAFFDRYGPIVRYGFTFEPNKGRDKDYAKMKIIRKGHWGGYTPTIDSGDGDFLTKDTIWDIKVLTNKPKTQHALQLLVYWIMGQHSGQRVFNTVSRVGIYNPRMNVAFLLDIAKLPAETIKAVEDEVICY